MDKITLKLCAIHSGMRNVFRNGIIEPAFRASFLI
jgi:hypothetical protein